jgi:hypothetical protein
MAENASNIYGTTFITTTAQIQSCYRSFPLSQTQRTAQLSSLQSIFNFYPYLDLINPPSTATHPDYIYRPQVPLDFMATFETLKTTPQIVSEFDLQLKIRDVLLSAQDGHLTYDPNCFNHLTLYQPFLFQPTPNSTTSYTILDTTRRAGSKDYDSFWARALNGSSASSFIGSEITHINNVPARGFMDSYGLLYASKSKDPSTRANVLLPSYKWTKRGVILKPGLFAVQTLMHGGNAEDVVYTVRRAGSLLNVSYAVPWAVVLGGGSIEKTKKMFESGEKYYRTYCSKKDGGVGESEEGGSVDSGDGNDNHKNDEGVDGSNSDSDASTSMMTGPEGSRTSDATDLINPSVEWQALHNAIPDPIPSDSSSFYQGSEGLKPLVNDAYQAFFMLSDNITGVWMLGSFNPTDSKKKDMGRFEWYKTMTTGVCIVYFSI